MCIDFNPNGITVSRAFSKDSHTCTISDFALPGTVGGWRVLKLPRLGGEGYKFWLANSWNCVKAFETEDSARAWAKLNKANPRGYIADNYSVTPFPK